jgi:hypothetical protein
VFVCLFVCSSDRHDSNTCVFGWSLSQQHASEDDDDDDDDDGGAAGGEGERDGRVDASLEGCWMTDGVAELRVDDEVLRARAVGPRVPYEPPTRVGDPDTRSSGQIDH